MQKTSHLLIAVTLALLSLANAASAGLPEIETKMPQRVASDLVVLSVDQGQFETQPADPTHFQNLDAVWRDDKHLHGWRMRVSTNRKSILVREDYSKVSGKASRSMHLVPKSGYIFSAYDPTFLLPGSYQYSLFVENKPVKHFTYEVRNTWHQ